MALALNLIGFQIGWFVCVIGAAQGQGHLAVTGALVIVAFHLFRNNSFSELYIILAAMLVGFIWESLLLNSGWLSYDLVGDFSLFAPIWLVAMWALFATTINLSMAWLKNRWLLASIMGALFGPLAFVAGERLGAVQFIDRPLALLALASGWAFLMPFMLWLADAFKHRFGSKEI